MNNSQKIERQMRRDKIKQIVEEAPLRFPSAEWRASSTQPAAALRRVNLLAKLLATGQNTVRHLASMMTEALEPSAMPLQLEVQPSEVILAKVIPLDDWPDVVKNAPWVKGSTLRVYVDHKDENGYHLIADLCPAREWVKPTREAAIVGVSLYASAEGEQSIAELRPNFTTRSFSSSIHAPLEELAITLVAV